ncbi:MAG: hypothetical protein GVX96_04780 [Bacteroidetes bacterium]|jgi:hypothetical protein|nr:hypothetical protein [Bacteroidota bacterium]
MKYFFLISILLFCACSQSVYDIVTSETYPPKEKPDQFKKVIYLDQTMASEGDRKIMAKILNKKRWEEFNKSVKPFSDDGRLFLVALKLFLSEQYELALKTLEKIDDSSFGCQVKILKADCLFEMEGSYNQDFRVLYQNAMDCTTSDLIQSIIHDRYKYLRYAK